jgi:hypothetical protein
VVIVAPTSSMANAIEIAARTKRGAMRHSRPFVAPLCYLVTVAPASMADLLVDIQKYLEAISCCAATKP